MLCVLVGFMVLQEWVLKCHLWTNEQLTNEQLTNEQLTMHSPMQPLF